MGKKPVRCKWVAFKEAVAAFVLCESGTESAGHIIPLHWYVACRLVVEGGFFPDDIVPRPPFVVRRTGQRFILEHDAKAGRAGERTVLGGLKTKAVDVVVTKNGLGPVLAVSLKGTQGAFRNLTNRMEEAVGDCTNLHIAYPALVYGFFQVLRGNREGPGVKSNDVAVLKSGQVAENIRRYHGVLARLADRADVRADTTKYEAVALALANVESGSGSALIPDFPDRNSPLLLADFFPKLYQQYDQRFVYAAPALASTTRRAQWDPSSPILKDKRINDCLPRLSGAE